MAKYKITNMEIKKKNRNRIFRFLCKSGVVSNPDIAYELNLSLPTVTQNTKELLELGLIQENGELDSTGGRKAKALSVMANARLAVGIDITKNHIGFLLTNLCGDILKYERVSCAFCAQEGYFRELSKKLDEFLAETSEDKNNILGVGISFPGIVDLDRKEITDSHALGIHSLFFPEVEKCFAYPCFFLNDANAGAYAEGIQNEDKKNFFYLSLSNTVGGALYSEGRLSYGSAFRCGEAGHMTLVPDGAECYCGKKGCLDSYCCARRLSERSGGKLDEFFAGVKQGNRELAAAWERYTDYLAIAVNNIHMLLDWEIVLGGYVGSYAEDFLQEIREKVSKRNTFSEDGTFVSVCKYKKGAAALGAALYIIEQFIEQV